MNSKNIIWNLLGLGLPLVIAALTIPSLINQIGAERFGLLAIAWGLIGYGGALDLGIGRATTQQVAKCIGTGNEEVIPEILKTAIRITAITGLIGFIIFFTATIFGGYRVIDTIETQEHEILIGMIMLALALPLQAVSATYKGINEAFLNFKGVSVVRIFLGITNFAGPFFISLITIDLHWIVLTLLVSRAIALIAYRHLAINCIGKDLLKIGRYNAKAFRNLMGFGGWVTLSSVISPFLVQGDRYLIGAMLGASAVTLYVIPYEVTVQALILVGAITTVAFPAIASMLTNDPDLAQLNFKLWLFRVTVLMFFVLGLLAFIMPYLLDFWVGEHITQESVLVGQIMCIGVFLNSIGSMYYAFLHANGRAKETALLHLFELPVFIILLYVLINGYGVVGAAVAWSIRVLIDLIGLVVFYLRFWKY